MRKIYSFFLVAVCLFATSFAYAATRTVYFQKPSQWADNVSVHIWGDGVGSNWDDDEISASRDANTGLYYYTFDDDRYTKVIFRIKGVETAQTNDIIIEDGAVYTCMRNKKSNSWKLGTVDQFEFVYFDDFKSNWGAGHETLSNLEPCVYYFKDNDTGSTDWPGTELVYDNELRCYKGFILNNGRTFIFNNGMSDDDAEKNNKQQTGNLTNYNTINYYGGSFPLNVYAVGTIGPKGGNVVSWAPDNGDFKLSYTGSGVFEIKDIQMFINSTIEETKTSFSAFRFHTKLAAWGEDSGTHYRPTEDKVLSVGTASITTEVTTDGTGDKNWKVITAEVDKSGNYFVYDLKLDLFNNKLTIDGSNHTTGVESISVEDSEAPVEYFNLQGVKVENPENGLYIVRQGNKVSKQLIR